MRLVFILQPIADALGLESFYGTGLFRPGTATNDYRVPDLLFARTEQISQRGVDGKAELVMELLSEGDESREKLGFYEQLGVSEVLSTIPKPGISSCMCSGATGCTSRFPT